MEKHTHTTFLLIIKNKNGHELGKKFFFKDLKNTWFRMTKGNLCHSGQFSDSKIGNPVNTLNFQEMLQGKVCKTILNLYCLNAILL